MCFSKPQVFHGGTSGLPKLGLSVCVGRVLSPSYPRSFAFYVLHLDFYIKFTIKKNEFWGEKNFKSLNDGIVETFIFFSNRSKSFFCIEITKISCFRNVWRIFAWDVLPFPTSSLISFWGITSFPLTVMLVDGESRYFPPQELKWPDLSSQSPRTERALLLQSHGLWICSEGHNEGTQGLDAFHQWYPDLSGDLARVLPSCSSRAAHVPAHFQLR